MANDGDVVAVILMVVVVIVCLSASLVWSAVLVPGWYLVASYFPWIVGRATGNQKKGTSWLRVAECTVIMGKSSPSRS